ncbi:response regulator transcription factor [Clostridium baratii]|uniref:response regulator transcription factor n=1 Tax=Clostridium baratii TaxID=1561 RepID=UPI0030CB135E
MKIGLITKKNNISKFNILFPNLNLLYLHSEIIPINKVDIILIDRFFYNDIENLIITLKNINVPIVLFNSKNKFVENILYFDLGVDDIVEESITEIELLYRIKAILKHSKSKYKFDLELKKECINNDLILNFKNHLIVTSNLTIKTTKLEFKLFYILYINKNKVVSKKILFNELYGTESTKSLNTVHICISRLKKKLCVCKSIKIDNIFGLGYKLLLE